jgi:tetratricopeptide (TPR) repeat protein
MQKARTLLAQSAQAWRELDNGREEATVLASLVSIEIEAGEFDIALASARRAIEVFAAENGDDDPQLGTHYLNLGNVFQRRGQYDDALAAFDQAVRRRGRAYGDEHVATAEARYSKGTALVDLGQPDQAMVLFERVQRDVPPGHVLVAAADMMLAQIASSSGDHELALALANKAFVFYETQFGAGHAQSAEVRIPLAKAKLAAGDVAGALMDARAARTVLEERFGTTHDAAGLCLALEAEALVQQGAPGLARPLYERALSIAVAAQGESSSRVVALREAIAVLGEAG